MQNSRIGRSDRDRTFASIETVPPSTVLVLGAGYAGLLAALRIAGKAGSRARVVLVNDGDHFVERVRLHQVAVGQPVPRRSLEKMTRGTGIDVIQGRATDLDPVRKRVMVGERVLSYDYLLHALGSVGATSGVPGVEAHALDVSTEAGADRAREALAGLSSGARVSIVGGGLTAIEMATELAETRADLTVRLVAPRVAPDFSDRARAYMLEAMAELGVEVREQARVVAVRRDAVVLADGSHIESDATIWCGGFQIGSSALGASLPKTADGQLALDACLVSRGFSNVFGAGDGSAIDTPAASFMRMSCAAAMPMAAHAADNIVRAIRGEELEPFGFAFAGRCVSLGRKRGILQRVTPDDLPVDSFVSGWLGARIKEAVCRYTTVSLAIERLLPGTFTWAGRKRSLSSDALLTA
ncbi:MAG: FAD-dependent oxidoreductase [Myxococcales bacterium]|nr:FAD-dependent oxidoreductase [Myxococcales bacterium]